MSMFSSPATVELRCEMSKAANDPLGYTIMEKAPTRAFT